MVRTTVRTLAPSTRPELPVTTYVAPESTASTATSTEVVPASRVTAPVVPSRITSSSFTVKEVNVPPAGRTLTWNVVVIVRRSASVITT